MLNIPRDQLALTLILTLLRRVVEVNQRLRAGERVPSISALAPGLYGKVVGLIGMGDIAYETAKLLVVCTRRDICHPLRTSSSSSCPLARLQLQNHCLFSYIIQDEVDTGRYQQLRHRHPAPEGFFYG